MLSHDIIFNHYNVSNPICNSSMFHIVSILCSCTLLLSFSDGMIQYLVGDFVLAKRLYLKYFLHCKIYTVQLFKLFKILSFAAV